MSKYSHDMFCTCSECIKLKGGASDTSKGSKYNEYTCRYCGPHNDPEHYKVCPHRKEVK